MAELMTAARPYAKAIFESALEKNGVEVWLRAIQSLADVVQSEPMQPILDNPLINKDELADLFITMGGVNLHEEAKRLVKLLADKKRLNLLPAIVGLYEDYVADHKKTMDVKVVSAYPIDEARVNRLRLALQENLKRQVTLQCSVDRSLLGGAIIYAGDQVIDGSLRSKLKKLADRLSS